MKLKTLSIELGEFKALQESALGQMPEPSAAGWYIDPRTGERVFYDPDSHKFYTLAGGIYIPLGYMNPAPKQITLAPGEKLRINMSFKYSGPAISSAICYYSIGVYGLFGFDEKMVGQNSKSLPQYTTPTQVTDSYTFTLPTNVGNDWDDIYCKIYGGSPGVPQTLFGYEQALLIIGKDPTISEFMIADFAKV
ncbi:hypothetical protein B1779_00440 [Dehalococcoides mccartyi]|uniref:hypothetical protein n=1 Tax=Dehalococcoides mccartyi TaxID=61435 RepID=UPI000994C55F|nr:hypothetical protein [Dehalococcoides mccartyi]AQW61794.1 hypothetical protein B1779_00440 [Dehalococcoides mccartyi]